MQNTADTNEIEALFQAGAHIGYSKAKRHPKMSSFVFGRRNNIEIFDLEQTAAKLQTAADFLERAGKEGKLVLWVGTKPAASSLIEETGKKLNAPFISGRWLGGTLTNFRIIEGRITYWLGLEREAATGALEKYSKKERLMKEFELRKLTKTFEGLRTLKKVPDAVVIVDPLEEKTALAEAKKKGAAVIALMNMDCSPDGITYPIPMNDNSLGAISIVLEKLSSAYQKGIKEKA